MTLLTGAAGAVGRALVDRLSALPVTSTGVSPAAVHPVAVAIPGAGPRAVQRWGEDRRSAFAAPRSGRAWPAT